MNVMTTIIIKNDSALNFKKTVFEDLNYFLNTITKYISNYSDPEFEDTVITKEIEDKAEEAKKRIKENPELFFEV